MKLNVANCILLFLLLLVSMVHLECTNSPFVIQFLNFVRLFRLQVLLIIILLVSFVIFSHLLFLMVTLAKILFLLFSQIKNANFSKTFLVSYDVNSLFTNIPLQESVDIAINLIFNHNPNLNITRKKTLKTFPFCYITDSKFYNQIDGVAMDFPLAPVLTNIFMGFHESK